MKKKHVVYLTIFIVSIVIVLTYFKLLSFNNHYSIGDIISLSVLIISLSVAFISYRQLLEQLDTKKKQQANKIGAWLLPENQERDYENFDNTLPHSFIPRTVQIKTVLLYQYMMYIFFLAQPNRLKVYLT